MGGSRSLNGRAAKTEEWIDDFIYSLERAPGLWGGIHHHCEMSLRQRVQTITSRGVISGWKRDRQGSAIAKLKVYEIYLWKHFVISTEALLPYH